MYTFAIFFANQNNMCTNSEEKDELSPGLMLQHWLSRRILTFKIGSHIQSVLLPQYNEVKPIMIAIPKISLSGLYEIRYYITKIVFIPQ